jgi:hypothetical protein
MGYSDEDECFLCYTLRLYNEDDRIHSCTICFHCMGTITELADGQFGGSSYTLNNKVVWYVEDCAICHQTKRGGFSPVALCKVCVDRYPKMDQSCVFCETSMDLDNRSMCVECLPNKDVLTNRHIAMIFCYACDKWALGLASVPVCSECLYRHNVAYEPI